MLRFSQLKLDHINIFMILLYLQRQTFALFLFAHGIIVRYFCSHVWKAWEEANG